jgi:hypothetical protein
MPGVAGIYEMGAWPFTTATALLCSLIYFYTWNYSVDLGTIAYSYQSRIPDSPGPKKSYSCRPGKAVLENHYSLICSRKYSPFGLQYDFSLESWNHRISGKVSSTFLCLSLKLGTIQYAKYTLLLVILSMVVVSVLSHVIIVYWRKEEQKAQQAVGYSWFVFSWSLCPDPLSLVLCSDGWQSSVFLILLLVSAI